MNSTLPPAADPRIAEWSRRIRSSDRTALTGPIHRLQPARSGCELAALVVEANSVSMWVKHFNPDFTGWEEKDDKVIFPLVRHEPDALHFDGLTFKRTSKDELDVYLAFGSRGGEVRETKLVYRRTSPVP